MPNGTILAIFIAPAAGSPMQSVSEVEAIAGSGLKGDRYALGQGSFNKNAGIGKRQVTLINAKFFIGSGFEYADSRRNLVVTGLELMLLIGKEFRIGEARMRGIKYCDPCQRPSTLSGKTENFQDVFHDHAGLVAEVIEGGLIRVGNLLTPPPRKFELA
jgi:MOSC domain-containing protein YiiM